jgi:general nucleoside transport system permease protein
MLEKAASASSAAAGAKTSLRLGRFVLEMRQEVSYVEHAVILGGFVLLGLSISAVILVAAGVPAKNLANEFILDTFSDPQSVRNVLQLAAPLAFIGLAAAAAFRVGFWNLGLEGQMIWGGIAGTYLSLHHIGPDSTRLLTMFVAAAAAGALWVLLAAFLKFRFRVNEILSTLLLGYIATYFLLYLLHGPWLDPRDGFPHSEYFAPYERLPDLWGGVSSAVPLAFVATILVAWLVHASRLALYMHFVHNDSLVALATGVPMRLVMVLAIGLSGALAGLGGEVILTSQEGRLTYTFFTGCGFSGILIAFLGRNHPFAVLGVAVLVAMLFVAGQNLQIFYQIPGSMVQVIEATIVLCVASADFFLRHRLHWIR